MWPKEVYFYIKVHKRTFFLMYQDHIKIIFKKITKIIEKNCIKKE